MKKIILLLILFSTFINNLFCQTVIKMKNENGIYTMPCKVNGLPLKLIFDTGASNVSISLTEALFMLKNDYLSKNDILGTEYYKVATGEIQEGTELILREIQIGDIVLKDIKASVVHEMNAPLLLGQSALSKFKKILFDYSNNTLSLFKNDFEYTAQKYNLNTDEAKMKVKISENLYIIPDNDIEIKNIKINTLTDRSRVIESFTILNKTEFNLSMVELRYKIYDRSLNLIKENTIKFNTPFLAGTEQEFKMANTDLKHLPGNTLVIDIYDWEIN